MIARSGSKRLKLGTLHRVADEDWPTFEPYSDVRTVPSEAGAFMALHADEWEVGCWLGDADTLCGVWVFRAPYDEVLVVTEPVRCWADGCSERHAPGVESASTREMLWRVGGSRIER